MRKMFVSFLLPGVAALALGQTPAAPTKPAATTAPAPSSPKDDVQAQQLKDTLKNAESSGIVLNSSSNVKESVNIEAVMLPYKIVEHVFGKEVSDNYAVIEVNVSNRNPDAAFILASLYIDYSQWGLAGATVGYNPHKDPHGYTSASDSRQVSSVEYRVIRGELLDQQPYTKRNMTYRGIKILGSIGTAFAFPFSPDVIKGINAWNGAVVPGFDELFPDGTTAQMNRISDFGFRNNKVIPQQSADIVIAFFPIKRFLSPTLEKTFKKSPALFFDPLLLAIDPKTRPGLEKLLENAFGSKAEVDAALKGLLAALAASDPDELASLAENVQQAETQVALDRRQLTAAQAKLSKTKEDQPQSAQQAIVNALITKQSDDEDAQKKAQNALTAKFTVANSGALYRFLSQISLSRVSVIVGGTMNVDEDAVPASISETCFDKPTADLWGTKGSKTCTIRGRFLLHGTPKFQTADGTDLGISDIAVTADASSSDLLTFTYTLKAPIDPPKFSLVVTKEGKNKTSVDSTPYAVSATVTLPAPTITNIAVDATTSTVTITGTNFFSGSKTDLLAVTLHLPKNANNSADVAVASPSVDSETQVTLPAASLTSVPDGCYQVLIKIGSGTATSVTTTNGLTITKGVPTVGACPAS